ncbi:hypothetical protein HD_1315 [[Haemophilus] ducreyi 35000HP]|uniref:Uncharacterized protein n=1 Tax=Haemophilus ducreyi (strain 35000HP / ATCC 700724) TaxID=233412 RepID=Q7VLU8_HAEDU|nr:hypothetical protein HD_1315 [[Haemophilus] ducreyi 35000HP]
MQVTLPQASRPTSLYAQTALSLHKIDKSGNRLSSHPPLTLASISAIK